MDILMLMVAFFLMTGIAILFARLLNLNPAESMIPAVLEAIPKLLKRGNQSIKDLDKAKETIESLNAEIKDLKQQIENNKNSVTLPNSEDKIFDFAKKAIDKIDDKSKLKDLGMIIMMKAM